MNSYADFAYLYDSLMTSDIDYGKWADYIENLFHYYDKNPNMVCDLACGTGNFTIPLAKRGYEMIGVDRSYDMLTVAREKAQEENLDILFLNQSVSRLDLYGTADAFLCMIDGFNYILSYQTLYAIFKRIKTCFIEPDGIFIFDLSSRYKLSETIGNNTFIHSSEDIFYTWENTYYKQKNISDMFLTFFKKDTDGKYERFEERHLQRGYSVSEIKYLLKKAGFAKVDVFDELSFTPPTNTSSRIVFAAQ